MAFLELETIDWDLEGRVLARSFEHELAILTWLIKRRQSSCQFRSKEILFENSNGKKNWNLFYGDSCRIRQLTDEIQRAVFDEFLDLTLI